MAELFLILCLITLAIALEARRRADAASAIADMVLTQVIKRG